MTWLHRLVCIAYAARGANTRVTLMSESFDAGHCRSCGQARVLDTTRKFRAGDIIWIRR